jgi:hypothetical protein
VALQQIFPSTAFRINLLLQKTNLLVLSHRSSSDQASKKQDHSRFPFHFATTGL